MTAPRSNRELTVAEVAKLLRGEAVVNDDGEEFMLSEAGRSSTFTGSRERVSIHRDSTFYHASVVPLETQLEDSASARKELGDVPNADKRAIMVSNMGTTAQYAIDNMLSEDAEGEGFYVYELKARRGRSLVVHNLNDTDDAVDFMDPFGASNELRARTGDSTAAYTFQSRYNDPGSLGIAADPGTMDVVGKRWVSAEEARKSPSIYNV